MNKFLTTHYNDSRADHKNTVRYCVRAAVLKSNLSGEVELYDLGGDLGYVSSRGDFRAKTKACTSLVLGRAIGTPNLSKDARLAYVHLIRDFKEKGW